MGPYRTPAEVPEESKVCGHVDDCPSGPCTDEVYPGHEFCCYHEHALWGDGTWRGCGNPGCICFS